MSKVKFMLAAVLLSLLPQLVHAQASDTTLIRSSVEPLPACIPAAQGQLQPMIWDVTAALSTPATAMKVCSAVNTWTSVGQISGGGTIAGSIAVNQVGFGAGANVLAGQSNFQFNSMTGFLSVPSLTASASITSPLINNVFTVDGNIYMTAQSAITAACAANGGTVDARGLGQSTITVSSTINLGCSSGSPLIVLFNVATIFKPANTSVDMFVHLPGAQVSGLTIDYSSVSGYAGNAYKFSGYPYQNAPGLATYPSTILDGLNVNGGLTNSSATDLYFQSISGNSDFIEFLRLNNISLTGGLYGVHVVTSNSSFFNGNNFDNLIVTGAVHGITMQTDATSSCNLNVFRDVQIEDRSNSSLLTGIQITGSFECDYNTFSNVTLWDFASGTKSIEVDSPALGNQFIGGLLLGQAIDTDQENYFYDYLNGFGWGGLNYATGSITAPVFNATTPQSAYRINNSAVLIADVPGNTYVSPQAPNTGFVALQTNIAGPVHTARLFSDGAWSIPGLSADPSPLPGEDSCWGLSSLGALSYRCEVNGIASSVVTTLNTTLTNGCATWTSNTLTSTNAPCVTGAVQSAGVVLAGPVSGSPATPAYRALVSTDIPTLNQNTTGTSGGLTGCAVSTVGSVCYWTGSAWTVLAGNASGTQYLQETASGVPSWTVPSGSGAFSGGLGASFQDVTEIAAPANPSSGNDRLYLNSSTHQLACLTSSGGSCVPSSGGGVSSVGLSQTGAFFTITGSPITTSGTINLAFATESANTIFAGPISGSAAAPTFRSMVSADVPTLNQNTTGTSGGLTGCSTSTAGSVCYWTGSAWTVLAGNASGTQFLQETSSGVPSWATAGAGNVTTSGSPAQYQTTVFSGSTSVTGVATGTTGYPLVSAGAAAYPAYGQLTSAGLNITTTACTNQVVTAIGSGAVGTCSTVANAMLANSSITINNPSFTTGWGTASLGGSLSPSWSSETANTFFAAPSGSSGSPTFRTVVSADIPTLNQNTTGTSGGLTGCSTSIAGSICYWTGSAWTVLAGNTTSIQYLQETSSGVPSWSAGSTTVSLSNIANAGGTNVLSNGNNPQTWNWAQTTASHTAMAFGETTAATGGSDLEVSVSTAAGSTAIPLTVINSLTGSQTLSAVSITPTWNTSGVVDAALKINVTNTASGTGSLLADFQIGGTSELTVDKIGNLVATGSVGTGSGSTGCGTATGCISQNEGSTAAASAAGTDTIRADSTAHNFKCSLNGASEFQCAAGYAVQGTDTKVLSSGTISGTAATLCTDSSGGATTSGCTSGTPSFPQTVAGTVTSGGIPYFNSTVQESSSGILNTNILVKGGGAGGAPSNSSITDNATTVTTTDTGGIVAPVFTSNGSTSGFEFFVQGSTSAAVTQCAASNTICEQAPASVTSYVINKPAAAPVNNNSAQIYTNASPGVGSWAKMSQTAITSGTAYTNATTSFTSVAGGTGQTLSFAVEASTNYVMSCHVLWSASAATAGPKFQFTGPASPTAVQYSVMQAVTATTDGTAGAVAFSTSLNASGATVVATTNEPADIQFGLVNGTTAGTVVLQAAAQGTGTVTIQPGSYCQMQ